MVERYEFRVRVLQGYTPESGQEAIKKIQAEGEKYTISGTIKIEIDGVTRHENPFPAKIQEELVNVLKLKYDEINFLYKHICENIEEARKLEREFCEWANSFMEDLRSNKEFTSENLELVHCLMNIRHSIEEYEIRCLDGQELANF
jgi:hypothetical protein